MMQIIPRPKSTSERFFDALGETAKGGVEAFAQTMQNQKNEQRFQQENQFLKKLGLDVGDVRDPRLRQEILSKALQGQQAESQFNYQKELQSQKFEQEKQLENFKNIAKMNLQGSDYNTIENHFGKDFADVWQVATEGGKTKLLDTAIDARLRGEDVENLLSEITSPESNISSFSDENIPQMKNGQLPKDFKWPDYTKRPKGYTSKEWTDARKEWRKENVPIFEANNAKLKSINDDILATKVLKKLSPKLPEGMERIIINPETGELYGIAQLAGLASPEVQEWVKTIARFQNRAKDAFGARVTNFDLVSYMKQFPGLLNTQEGRDRILRMMDINYDLDKLHANALQKVYQKYGLNNIPQEEADKLAKGMIRDETDRLETEYLGIDAKNQKSISQSKLSGKIIDVMGPDGEMYEIDENEIDQLPEGYRII